jgi:hypothetical protein
MDMRVRSLAAWILVCAIVTTGAAANQQDKERQVWRDLAADESMGGHTLARHVGKTDAQLADRLRREPQISAASTYTDREMAERTVRAALTAFSRKVNDWERRTGRRPNLVLHYTARGGPPLGRSLARGQTRAAPASRAIIVLRWDDRVRRWYVLTSYPEADR